MQHCHMLGYMLMSAQGQGRDPKEEAILQLYFDLRFHPQHTARSVLSCHPSESPVVRPTGSLDGTDCEG